MYSYSDKRRTLIKAGLTVPLLSHIALPAPAAQTAEGSRLLLPPRLLAEARRLYGDEADNILVTDRLELHAPVIAENGAVVPVRVSGARELVSSLAVLIEQGPSPLGGFFTLYDGVDIPVRLRVRLPKTSDLYLLAQTSQGLLGTKANVKVTIGCGGG